MTKAAKPREGSGEGEAAIEPGALETDEYTLAARDDALLTASPDGVEGARPSILPKAGLPKAGDVLRDRFLLLREIGAGRSGIVFVARDERDEREVAVKVLRHPGALERFKQEYRRLCDLAHPNVVAALELYAEGEPAFLIMPHIEGLHLDAALFELPPDERREVARELFGQLALALAALHAVGLVHRDVKPSNVIVSNDKRAWLVDFGLVSRAESLENALYGTPAYVAPELVSGAHATPASDWYSFGTMLYQALSGGLPFTGAVDEVLAKKRSMDPPPLAEELRGGDDELAGLAMALIARDPSERPLARVILETLGVRDERPPPSLFIGREKELAALSALYARAASGEPSALEIVGPSGIGKSSLAARFMELIEGTGEDSAHAVRPLTLRSLCYENEHGSFKAIDDLLTGLFDGELSLRELGGASSTSLDDASASAHEGDLLGASLAELFASRLHELSEERPMIFLIDQLQWADADSARVLADAWPLLSGARVLFLFVSRDDQRALSPFIRYLDDHLPSLLEGRLNLGPLEPPDSLELMRHLGGDAASAIEASGGNPMILSWMARGESALLSSDDEAREVGAWIALAGHPIPLEALERGFENDREGAREIASVAGAARRLEAQRMIKKSVHRGVPMLMPVHDWTQAQLLRGLSSERAREIHRSLGAALVGVSSSTPEEIAGHYYRAADYAAMLPYAERAADRARELGARSAEALWLERILEGGAELGIDRGALRLRAAAAHAAGGWGREAASHYQALIKTQTLSLAREAELRLRASEQLFRCGEWEQGYLELRGVLSSLGLPLPRSKASLIAQLVLTRVRLRAHDFDAPMRPDDELSELTIVRLRAYSVATLAHLAYDPLVGAYYASQHLLLTLRERAGQHLLRALADELVMLTGQGGVRTERESARLEAKIKALSTKEQRPEDRLYAESMLGIIPLQAGRFAEASAALGASERRLAGSAIFAPWELAICRMLLLTSEMFHRGLGGQLRTSLDAWIEEARMRRDDAALRFLLIKRVLSHIADDDVEGAHAVALEAEGMLLTKPNAVDMDSAMHLNMRVFLYFYEGCQDAALNRSLRAELERVLRSNIAQNRGLKATAAALLGGLFLLERASSQNEPRRTKAIDRRLERIDRLLHADGADYSRGFARLLIATRAHQNGEVRGAIAALEDAASAFERAGMRPAHAVALARRAQLIGAEAEGALKEALTALASLGVREPLLYLRVHAPGF